MNRNQQFVVTVWIFAVLIGGTLYALGGCDFHAKIESKQPPQTTEVPVTATVAEPTPTPTPDPQPPTPIAEDSAKSDVKEAPPACTAGGCSSGSCSRPVFRPIRGLFRK
jgi:hypothetical protein